MRFRGSDTVSKHAIVYLLHTSFSIDLSAPLRTSPHLYFILLYSKVIVILLQNRVLDHHRTRPYEKYPVTPNSRAAQGLSDNVKIIENGEHLTTWLVPESGHIQTVQHLANFDNVYLRPQRCGEVRFFEILIVLIYSINCQNLAYLKHQQRHSYIRSTWPNARDFPLVFA